MKSKSNRKEAEIDFQKTKLLLNCQILWNLCREETNYKTKTQKKSIQQTVTEHS